MAETETTEPETTTEQTDVRTPVDILQPDTCPPALRKFYSDDQRKAIAAEVAQGNIVTEVKNVKISKKNSGSGKDELWPFILYRAVQAPGMTALAKGNARAGKPIPENYKDLSDNDQKKADVANEDGACDYFNYGFGLTITQPIRVMMASRVGGPDKEIEKQIRQVMKTGLFASEDMAKEFVISQRKTMNMTVPDAFAETDDNEA
jgi:hypothetical protein